MSCFWRTKIVCFTSFKGQFNPGKGKNRWKCKTLQWWTRQYVLFLLFVNAKIWPPHVEVISSRKILFWNIFKNQCGFNYFWTKIYSWAKFKGNWFSDPKRSGPVLGRLPLNSSNFKITIAGVENHIKNPFQWSECLI